MNTDKQNRSFPEQQRQQLLAELSSDGVTQPAAVSRLKLFITAMFKITVVIGVWILLLELAGWLLDPAGAVFTIFGFFWFFILAPWMAAKFIRPVAAPMSAELHWGRNASRAIMGSKIAPVLYLRSFQFDAVAQRVNWFENWGAWEVASNPEMNLAARVAARVGAKGAPLLAIGKPDEPGLLPGALRFWVRHDLWKEKISAIAPLCSLVIWTTGYTEGLDWEIQYLIKNIEPTKILLWLHAQFAASRAERDIEWAKFVERYKDVFPRTLPNNVNKVRFIAFDEQWTPIPIPGKEFPATFAERFLRAGGRNTHGLANFLNARIR
jgi:hypothetical protein